MSPKRPTPPGSPLAIVAHYRVGGHQVQVSKADGRWAVAVDDVALTNWFMTQAEAWEAGVREADRIDRLA